MIAALATLAFLATMWLIAVVALQTAGESGAKILAALAGRSLLASETVPATVAVRVRQRGRQQRTMRAQPRLRAAA